MPLNQNDSETEEVDYLPGFDQPEDPRLEQKLESRKNLAVLCVVLLLFLPLFFLGHDFFRTPSDEHFLIGKPIINFNSLQPVLGGESLPTSSEFTNQSLFIILWGPWDRHSCNLLQQLCPVLQKAQKNPAFKMIPIAYFADTRELSKWEDMSQEERTQFLLQKQIETENMGRAVRNSFRHGFQFSAVWWDPVDQFRQNLMELALADEPQNGSINPNVIAFPTVIYAEKGVILKVWTSDSQEDLREISDTLETLAISAP